MLFADQLVLQGILFTGLALGFFGLLTWWFYFSPVRPRTHAVAPPSPMVTGGLVGILALSSNAMVVGALWDASMHIKTGEIPGGSDFLWPPHILIYSGFFLAFLAAGLAMVVIAVMGRRARLVDPRLWIRGNPYLGAVALASVYSLTSIPGDAIWHELFGIDLTAWSPPHLILAATSSTVVLCAAALLNQTRFARLAGTTKAMATCALLGLMLNILYIIGVLEWELPGTRSALVEARPIWLYPLVGGALAFSTLLLAKRLTRYRWAATVTAVTFYIVRLAVMLGLQLTDNVVPLFPLIFLVGAFLLDVVPWEVLPSHIGRILAAPVLFTAGYLLPTLPVLALRPDLDTFQTWDMVVTGMLFLLVSLLLIPIINFAGKRLGSKHAINLSEYSKNLPI
jgi:hypothetical protein